MRKIEEVKAQIRSLSDSELGDFRQWYADFDVPVWDEKFEADVKSGKLDGLGENARCAHPEGKSMKL